MYIDDSVLLASLPYLIKMPLTIESVLCIGNVTVPANSAESEGTVTGTVQVQVVVRLVLKT